MNFTTTKSKVKMTTLTSVLSINFIDKNIHR